jgi:hypothetical protein
MVPSFQKIAIDPDCLNASEVRNAHLAETTMNPLAIICQTGSIRNCRPHFAKTVPFLEAVRARSLRISRNHLRVFTGAEFTQVEKELEGKGSGRRTIGKEDYQAKGCMYLPPKARFSHLLALPEGENIGKAINEL